MKDIWTVIRTVIATLGGAFGWFFGGMDGLLIALIIFMAVDYITGVMCAIVDRKLSSAVGFRGLAKKVLILMLVGVGHMLDVHVIGNGSVLRTAVIFFYLSNEGISMIENACRLGLPVPKKLKDVLAQLHDKSEGEEKEDTNDESEKGNSD